MFELISTVSAILVLLVASLQDLKKREVMDWLNIGLIFFAVILRLNFYLMSYDLSYVVDGFYGFLIGVSISYLLFYTGQWGGGDSKLLMGMSLLIGYSRFLIIFIIYIFLAGAVFGFFYSIGLAIKNKKRFLEEFKTIFVEYRFIHSVILIASIVLIFFLFISSPLVKMSIAMFIVLMLSFFYLMLFTKSVEKGCMIKSYNPMKLTEGDWIVEDVKYNGKYLAGPKDLGIEKSQIAKIQKLYKQNKIKSVLVKEGIPFVPSFLFAYILTLFYANLFNFLL